MGTPTALAGAALATLAAAILAPAPAPADPAATAPRFPPGTRPADVVVCAVPLGKVDDDVVRAVGRGIAAAYGFTTRALPAQPLPRAAYYRPRRRYKADRLLDHLATEVVPDSGCEVVIGVAAVDISVKTETHTDWGVLGLAYLDSHVGVISTFRAGRKVSRTTMLERTVKTATHELGHALGLAHDDSVAGCMMNDAHGTVASIDDETGAPCPHERAALEARLGLSLPVVPSLDWDAILAP
ncbi:MAG TPA: archaemetzincin [Kofleriaceae bacterium]|nr:archaemetzincin [Kofleriaceae bacterium]